MKLPFSYTETSKLVKAATLVVTVGVLQACSSIPDNSNLVEIQPISTEQQLAQHLAEWETYKPQLEALLAAKESKKDLTQPDQTEASVTTSASTTPVNEVEQVMEKTSAESAAAQFQPKDKIPPVAPQTVEQEQIVSAPTETTTTPVVVAKTEEKTAVIQPGVTITPAPEVPVESVTPTLQKEEMAAKTPVSDVTAATDANTAVAPIAEPMEKESPTMAKSEPAASSQVMTAKKVKEPVTTEKNTAKAVSVEEPKKAVPEKDGEYVVAQMAPSANLDENDAKSGSLEYTLSNDVLLDGDSDPSAEPVTPPTPIRAKDNKAAEDRYVRAQFKESEQAKKLRLAKEAAERKAQEAAAKAAQQQKIAAPKVVAKVEASIPAPAVKKSVVKKKAPKVGEYGLQLVSHTRVGEAEKSWNKISRKFRTLLAGKEPIVEQAKVKNRQYYRLKVGPYFNKNIAIDTCKQLVLSHQDCIVSNYYGEPLE